MEFDVCFTTLITEVNLIPKIRFKLEVFEVEIGIVQLAMSTTRDYFELVAIFKAQSHFNSGKNSRRFCRYLKLSQE